MSDPWAEFTPANDPYAELQQAKKPLDKYQKAAAEEYKKRKEAGVPTGESVANEFVNGATFGAGSTISSVLQTPIEMLVRGTANPVEAYNYARAYNDLSRDKTREDHRVAATAINLAGGLGVAGGLAKNGVTLVKEGQGLLSRVGAMAGEGAAYGGLTGFNEGNGIEDRLSGAGKGAALGGAIGGALPVVGRALSSVAAPAVSNVMARIDPEGSARARLARALSESGLTSAKVGREVENAANSGQGVYTVADALGKPGQELMSMVARAPGEGQTAVHNFLEARQAGQGRRLSNALSEGFDAPQTADQTVAAMRAQRTANANTNYEAARNSAGAVDVSPAIEAADRNLYPGASRLFNPGTEVGSDTVTGVVSRAKTMLTNGKQNLSDFNEAMQVKRDLDSIIEGLNPTQQRALIPIRNALDEQLAATSGPYANARNVFRQQSREIEAVDQGRAAAARGRHEDTVPAFTAMSPGEQAGFRVGYADPLIEQTQGAAYGVNKARPFTSDAHQVEFLAFAAPGQADNLTGRIARENTMFETRARALGGSKTADNLANEAAAGIDPRIFWNALHGNWGAAASNAIHAGKNALTGNTPAVRAEIARLLMMRGPGADVAPMLLQVESELARKQQIAAALSRGLVAAEGEQIGQRSR